MRTNFRESTPVTYLQVSEEGGKGSGFVFSRHADRVRMHARHGRRRGLVSGIRGCWIKPLSFGMSGLGYYRMWSWNLIVIPLILCPEISGMAGDHGNVHVVDSKRAWDSKIDEAQSTGKVVSVFWSFTHEDHVPISECRFNSHKAGYFRHKCLWVKSDVSDTGTTSHGYELWTGCGGFHGHLVWTVPPHVSDFHRTEQEISIPHLS